MVVDRCTGGSFRLEGDGRRYYLDQEERVGKTGLRVTGSVDSFDLLFSQWTEDGTF